MLIAREDAAGSKVVCCSILVDGIDLVIGVDEIAVVLLVSALELGVESIAEAIRAVAERDEYVDVPRARVDVAIGVLMTFCVFVSFERRDQSRPDKNPSTRPNGLSAIIAQPLRSDDRCIKPNMPNGCSVLLHSSNLLLSA